MFVGIFENIWIMKELCQWPQAKKDESWECKNNSKKDILGKQGLWIKISGTDFCSAQVPCFLKEQTLLVCTCKGTGGPCAVLKCRWNVLYRWLEDCRRKQNIVPGTENSVEKKMARRVCPRREQPGTVWKLEAFKPPPASSWRNKTVKKKRGRKLNSTQIQLSLGKGYPLIRKEQPPVKVA